MSNDSSNLTNKTGRFPHPIEAFFITIGLFLLGQLLATFLVQIIMLLDGGRADRPELFGSPILLQFAFGLLSYGLMLLMTIAYLRARRLSIRDLGLVRPRWSDLGRALIALVVYISTYLVAAAILKQLFPGLDLDQRQDLGFDDAEGAGYLALIFVLLVVIAPIAEEILMRGLLFTSLRRRSSFWIAAIVTSLLFAALHLGGGEQGAGPLWIAAVDTFVLSLVLCYLRERTGRLWAGIGLHALKNGIAFSALFLVVGS